PAEIGDEQERRGEVRDGADVHARLGETLVAGDARQPVEDRAAAGDAAREQVPGDLGLPDRLLDDRAAVVRPHLGAARSDGSVGAHSAPPANAASRPTTTPAAASAVVRHSFGRCVVGTTGSGGRPYTSGSSSSRKNAPKPPTPSSGSRPYSRAPFQRSARSFSSRLSARSRSSSSSPNWIESVGHALAHAGSWPPFKRS